MSRIKSLADLLEVCEQQQTVISAKETGGAYESQVTIKIAMATCGIASGARDTMEFMTEALKKRGVEANIVQVGCMGYCYAEPTIEVRRPGSEPVVFGGVGREKADEIIEKFIKKGELVDGIIPVNYETIESKNIGNG
jgi:NADP-reducing hydrogenase subunit HndB